jgi:hypothetical protein
LCACSYSQDRRFAVYTVVFLLLRRCTLIALSVFLVRSSSNSILLRRVAVLSAHILVYALQTGVMRSNADGVDNAVEAVSLLVLVARVKEMPDLCENVDIDGQPFANDLLPLHTFDALKRPPDERMLQERLWIAHLDLSCRDAV